MEKAPALHQTAVVFIQFLAKFGQRILVSFPQQWLCAGAVFRQFCFRFREFGVPGQLRRAHIRKTAELKTLSPTFLQQG